MKATLSQLGEYADRSDLTLNKLLCSSTVYILQLLNRFQVYGADLFLIKQPFSG